MSTGTTNGSSTMSVDSPRAAGGNFKATRVSTLDELVGAHPDALRSIYRSGKATDPAELGASPRGLFLAVEPTREIHFLVRPIMDALRGRLMPWKGKTFDADGTGRNLVFGQERVPFEHETGPSDLDGEPTLIIRYNRAEHGNPWPVRNIRDELRTIADGVAIGPMLFSASDSGDRRVVLWFGLTRQG